MRNASEAFFRPRDFERRGRLYEKLGMHFASRLLGYWNYLGYGSNFKIKNWTSGRIGHLNLESVERKTRKLEAAHWALTAFAAAVTPALPLIGAGFALGNAYISLVHRYNRARVTNILDKMRKKSLRVK